MLWVVVALCILVALTALVLSIPVDLDLRAVVHGRASAYIRVEWLFGRVGKTYRTGERAEESERSRVVKQKKGRVAEKKKRTPGVVATARSKGRLVWVLVRLPGLWHHVIRFVISVVRCIRVRVLHVDIRVDLGDPVDTALIVGGVSQAAMMSIMWSSHTFRVMPSFFGDAILDGETSMAFRLRPICVVPPMLRLVFSPATLRAIVALVRYRWGTDR